jgi:hypothetical protein
MPLDGALFSTLEIIFFVFMTGNYLLQVLTPLKGVLKSYRFITCDTAIGLF